MAWSTRQQPIDTLFVSSNRFADALLDHSYRLRLFSLLERRVSEVPLYKVRLTFMVLV